MANPISAAAAGTFIDTSDTFIVASYPAEELIHVQPGQEVELAFKSKPGYLFQGEVENILEATGQGQFTPGGKLPSAEDVGSPGFFAVKIRLNDKEQAAGLALGTPGTVAIYTGWAKALRPHRQSGDPHAQVAVLPALAAENVAANSTAKHKRRRNHEIHEKGKKCGSFTRFSFPVLISSFVCFVYFVVGPNDFPDSFEPGASNEVSGLIVE